MADNINQNNNDNNKIDDKELQAYINARLEEERNKKVSDSLTVKLDALAIVGRLMIAFVLLIFIVCPFIQLIVRVITDSQEEVISSNSLNVHRYQWTINTINRVGRFTVVMICAWALVYKIVSIKNAKKISMTVEAKADKKLHIGRFLPLLFFLLYVIDIIVVTKVRGANEYDLTGHPYMYESIYSYMTYPLVYFFCGMLVKSRKTRKILVYSLICTGLPINILSLVNEWFVTIPYYTKNGVCAIFHNSNHYGYYLVLVILSSALLWAYEQSFVMRLIESLSFSAGTMVLVINNTLGAYLAVAFVLVLFTVYAFVMDRKAKKAGEENETENNGQKMFLKATLIIASFLVITMAMSFSYKTVTKSVKVLTKDVGDILEDPTSQKAAKAGSSRWRLWKGTAKYVLEKPLVGYGVEGLLNTHKIGTPHNEFLQYAEFFGVPAMLLYIIAAWIVLWRVFFSKKKMSDITMVCFFVTIGYLASSFFGVAIYYATPFLYIFLGLTYADYFSLAGEKENNEIVAMDK